MKTLKSILKQQNSIVAILCFVMATFIIVSCEEQAPWSGKEDPKAFDTVTIDLNDPVNGWNWRHPTFPSYDGRYFDTNKVYVINSQEEFYFHTYGTEKPNINFSQYSVIAACFTMPGDKECHSDYVLLQTSDSTYKLSFTVIQNENLIAATNQVLAWQVPKTTQNPIFELKITYINPYYEPY